VAEEYRRSACEILLVNRTPDLCVILECETVIVSVLRFIARRQLVERERILVHLQQ
jgi:hypothetical protein